MNLLRAVTLLRANRKSDKSVSLTFETGLEQSSEQFMEIDMAVGMAGYLMFKPESQLTDKEIKAIESLKTDLGGKSKSKRLMNVLFVYWETVNKHGFEDFADFYEVQMEKYIGEIKETLPDR